MSNPIAYPVFRTTTPCWPCAWRGSWWLWATGGTRRFPWTSPQLSTDLAYLSSHLPLWAMAAGILEPALAAVGVPIDGPQQTRRIEDIGGRGAVPGSGRVGSGRVGSGRVGSGRVGSA
ncbi:hypothetical protein [Streptomyces sp. NBC_00299]|uniref:hypothetical protein n=1 Tax=Streptomyces sp. NBC_00299 TaxID=2975705 RepID=UPI002E285B8A|nr:hypothetical protein [Streptomyces sp. NBC_00299]